MKSPDSSSEEIKLCEPFSGWWYLVILVPIIIFNILRFIVRDSDPGSKLPTAIGHADNRGVDILVTKGSKRTVTVKAAYTASAVDPNVTLIYRYNGGNGHVGGFQELVPPKKDWGRLHYLPKTNLVNIDQISFEIPQNSKVKRTWVRYRSDNYQVLPY